jgi:hypothetical protein
VQILRALEAVVLEVAQPEEAMNFFMDQLGLPEAWPLQSNGGASGGGGRLGISSPQGVALG